MMFVITEDHGTDDYMEILAVTDDEGVAQEMVLALTEELIYNSFYEALHASSSWGDSLVQDVIKSYTKIRLIHFSICYHYEKVPFIN